ncbi:unnamed protein product [Schistosoma rodhaini]|uniref:protein-tyrosine-phosphatase n=1 Tax=Schistosoma rodhaini TaxID=6188 RepID=A0AA85G8G7_9TREM|nr:unnamed protein product [Schistosoma rodhaini]
MISHMLVIVLHTFTNMLFLFGKPSKLSMYTNADKSLGNNYLFILSLLLLSWINYGETRRGDLNNPYNHIRPLPESKRLPIELNRSEKLFINKEYMRKYHFLLDNFTPLQNITYYHDISSTDDGLKEQYKHDDRNYHQSEILGRLRRSYFTNYDHSDQTIYYIQKKPQIIEEPKSVITIVGQSVIFVCLAEGNPAPKVQWKVSGTSVSESRFGKTFRAPRGSILRVNNVLPSYNGAVITCTATNALGQAVNSATLTVYSDESNAPSGYPRFLNSFSVIVARKNSEVELECRATGDPIPEITWFRDSIPIDLANPRYKKQDVGNLRIQNLVEEDEGKYECEAKNDKGTRLSSGDNLLVRENVEASLQMLAPSTKRFRPHFTNVPSSRQIIPPGGQLTLSCTAVGAPVPNVQWYRDKQILPGEQLNKQPPGTAKLVLTNLLKSVNVTCVAESIIGRIYHDIQVIVKNLPDPPGDFQLIELGATHARIALKPSTSLPSSVRNYLMLWLPSSQFTNQTLYELPHQFNLLINQPGDQIEPIMLSNTEHSRPNLIMLPKYLKNISLSSISNYHLHQQRQQQFQQSDINQQINNNNNNLISEEITNPYSLYNILVISLTQLKPYTEYTLWARTVGEDGDTSLPNQPFLFTTKELAPSSPPLNVYAQALSNAAVTVYWDPPIESNGRIRAYRIYYTNNPTLEFSYWDTSIVNLEALKSQSITSSVTTYKKNDEQINLPGHLSILSHLTTNATYYLRVSAVNGQGEGPASDISVVIVRPGVLSKPQNFTATTQSPHEILLQWNPPNDVDPNTRPLEYYELDYQSILDIKKSPDHLSWFNRQTINSVDKSKTIDSKRKHQQQQTSIIHIRPDVTSYLLNNLEPDTHYLFNLIAVSKTGHGVKASTVARTNQFIPSAPKNLTVQAISATQLQVKWKRPIISDQISDILSSTRIAYYDLTWRQTDSEGLWSRNDISSGNHQPPAWFNQSLQLSSSSSPSSSGIFETNTFGSLQIPTHNKWSSDENHTNLTQSWYSANITGLQPSTYYVIHLRAVSQSGAGDTAVSLPVKTWNEPPSAPQKLRLISQIIPQSSINSPPQILLRITWEPVWYDGYKVGEMSTLYRIRWRLIGGERNFKGAEQSLVIRTLRSTDKYSSESTLYWPIIEKQQKHQQIEPQQHQHQFIEYGARNPFQSESLIPTKFLHGEVNLTETSWNPASGIFLLGMSYEFRVAVITTLQIGYETIETVSFEGTAPTNIPTSIQVSYTLDQIILSWNPPDWDHRHGIFESYEIKCYRSKPSMNVSHVDVDEKMNNQLKSYEDQYFNVTLLNSRVQWPISAPNDLLNIIPWPSGQIRLNYPNDFNYKHGEIDSRLNNNDNTVRYDNSNNKNNIYACVIRAVNVYGFGPWSTEKIILPKKPSIPSSPDNLRAIFLNQHQLRISWSLPIHLIQSISSHLITKLTKNDIHKLIISLENNYLYFAIYISPIIKINWKRYTTKGPTTELILNDYDEKINYLVRISSVSINEHESKWSEPISTERIESINSNLAIKVYNSKCRLFYRSQTDLWQLQVKWEVPKQLQTGSYFDQLSHYRINYTMIKSTMKYTTHIIPIVNRELSLNKLDSYKNKFILQNWLYTSESDSIYGISIRPVFKGNKLQTDMDTYIKQPYGILENNLCYIPKKNMFHVPVPVILLNPFIDKTNYFLIGIKPIKWIQASSTPSSSSSSSSSSSWIRQDLPITYELIAYKLPIYNNNIQTIEQLKLGQWNSSELLSLLIHHSISDSLIQIELSQSLNDTSLRYEKKSEKLLIGKALAINQDYALCMKVCLQPNKHFYSFNIMDNNVKHEPVCYESKWIQPVSTNRPSPLIDSLNDTINSQLNDYYDPDELLWSINSFGSHSPPPSDDATAQGPGRVTNMELSNIHKNHQLNNDILIINKNQQLSQNIPKSLDKQLSITSNVTNQSKITILSIGITIIILVLLLGLICFLLIIYKRKRLTEINKYKFSNNNNTTNNFNSSKNNKSSIPLKWNNYSNINYYILRCLTLNKYKTKQKLYNLNDIIHHSPPPGSNSISINLQSTFTSYPIDLVSTTITTTTPPSPPQPMETTTTTRLYELTGYTNPIINTITNNNLLYSQSNDEIRNFTNTIHNEMNPNYLSDSPNTTLYINDHYKKSKLNRVGSISLSYHHTYQLNSPTLSSSNVIYGSNCMKSDQMDLNINNTNSTTTNNNGIGLLGSLKSVSTMGSKNVQSLNGIDDDNLLSPISNGRCRNLLNSIPNRPQICGPIQVANLIEHVQSLKADNGRLMAAEFESIDPGGPFTWEHSNRPANRSKNRYANVIAYDHSRVVLQLTGNNDPDSDYINANYLDGYCKQNAYIATQGPLPHTITDFWRMVWEQHSGMIVSMTRLEEKARVKCEQYWPGNTNGINGSSSSNNMKSDNNCVITSCRPSPSITSRINSTSSNKKLNDFKMKLYDKSILPPPINFRTSVNLKESNEEQQFNEFHCDNNNNNVISDDLIFTNGLSHLSQSTINFGDISVSLLDTMELAYYTVRSFVLQKAGTIETREVRQLQFTAWPDHGVPNHPAPLLMFLRRVRAECPADSGPIIVHCSAGVGRTGAFILLDILLEQMRHEKAVDVFNTVSRLRAQRNFMVQTEDQYAFIYEALVEAASSGNTEIPVHQLTTHWFRLTDLNRLKCQDLMNSDPLSIGLMKTSMNHTSSSNISTGLELEFYQLLIQSNLTKLISSIPSSIGLLSPIDPFSLKMDEKIYGNMNLNSNNTSTIGCMNIPQLPRSIVGMSTNKSIAAMLPVNLSKNRSLSIIPHDANRVALRAVRGVEGSDYINASYIDGYRSRAAYIATQTPMMNTLEDFWRMIWESGSCLIVKLDGTITLNDLKFMDSPTYWPNLQSARHGFLVVDPIATYTMPAYIMRELRLTDTRDGSTRTVRQFDASSTADALIHLERQIYYSTSNKSDFKEFIESSQPITGSTITTASSTITPFPPNPSSILETSFTEDDFLRFNQIPTHMISTFRQCYQPICESMLELISQVHKTKEHFGIDGPITVHCNLGSGITGVFLAISLVLERMRFEGVIDMFQTVKLLRWQRPGLVQTVSQYAFCYATALEYLESFERYTT